MSFAAIFGIPDEVFTWVIVPLLIFLARIVDVSISTVRTVLMMSGKKSLSAAIGFFEALVWLIAINEILKNISNPITFVAYAGGFGMGVYVGLLIEEKLAMGKVLIHIMTIEDPTDLINQLRQLGLGVTKLNAEGKKGAVAVIFTIIKREKVERIERIIHEHNPKAFYTIESVKFAKDIDHEGLFEPEPATPTFYKQPLMWLRNRK